jgi:GxxExxY protein
MLYEDLTGKTLQACFEVSKELGTGFLESVYEKALLVALRQKGLRANNQVPLEVKFCSEIVGEFFVDILVEDKILIELKTASGLTKEHYAQTINYLKATNIEVGLLINFGNPKLEYRRFNNRFLEGEKIIDVKNLLSS